VLLGKRKKIGTLKTFSGNRDSDSDSLNEGEGEFDLMKAARKQVIERDVKEAILLKKKQE
jgi:hypothetical protein